MASQDNIQVTIARINAAVGDLGSRIDEFERRHEDCDCKKIRKELDQVTRWVNGDPELGVPNLRTQVNELYLTHMRLKWTAALLGIVSGGTAIGVLNFILGG
jgi:hypothetical protein